MMNISCTCSGNGAPVTCMYTKGNFTALKLTSRRGYISAKIWYNQTNKTKGAIHMAKLVNCTNYYNEQSLAELQALLEQGEAVQIYIDCIGHTRTMNETALYVEALQKAYGDRLQADNSSFLTVYTLK